MLEVHLLSSRSDYIASRFLCKFGAKASCDKNASEMYYYECSTKASRLI